MALYLLRLNVEVNMAFHIDIHVRLSVPEKLIRDLIALVDTS